MEAVLKKFHIDTDEICLIDSGNDKDAGRKVRQIREVLV